MMIRKRKKQKLRTRIGKTLFNIISVIFCFTIIQVISLKYINPPFTPNLVWEWVECTVNKQPEKCPLYIFKNLEDISPNLQRAVIAAEDQRFLSHNGFDFNEIKNAFTALIERGRLRGASTISMQTARSVFLLSSKRIYRKIAEIYYTVLIELFWDKRRILEIYLNTVDWGTNITGAEAASRKYFSKSAKHLTRDQAALMTAVLPNPHILSAVKPNEYLKKRQRKIIQDIHLMPLL